MPPNPRPPNPRPSNPRPPSREPSGDDPCRRVAGLHLGAWAEVRPLLLPRLVPRGRAGPLAHPTHRTEGRTEDLADSPLAWDVGIEVGDGGDADSTIVLVDRGLAGAWEVDRATVWEAARSNLATRPDPPWATVGDGPVRHRLVTGGPWTTGWLLLADRWPASAVAVAVAPDLVVLADRPAGGGLIGSTDPAGPVGPLLALAGRLAGIRPDAWPLVPLELRAVGTFP